MPGVVADHPFTFRATLYPTSAIDNFADAELLTLGCTSNATWDTTGGTTEPGEPLRCGGTRTAWLWYLITPASSGSLEVSVDGKRTNGFWNFSPAVAIHSADNGAALACAENSTFNVTQVVAVEAGASYLVAVGAVNRPGDCRLHWAVK